MLLGPSFQLMLISIDASVLESTPSWEVGPGFVPLALVGSWLIWQQQRPLFFRRRFFADFAVPAEISNLLQIFRKWTTQRFRQQQVEEPADDGATSKDGHDDPGVLLGLVGNPGWQCYETLFFSARHWRWSGWPENMKKLPNFLKRGQNGAEISTSKLNLKVQYIYMEPHFKP